MSSERIARIVGLLDAWPGKLTWDALIKGLQDDTGIQYSRAMLANCHPVADAFRKRKQADHGDPAHAPSSVTSL